MKKLSPILLAALLMSLSAKADDQTIWDIYKPNMTEADRQSAKDFIKNKPRPIEAGQSVFMEELTWMEVRDAVAAGKTSIIVPTGGVEQAGPFVVTGKHNFILEPLTKMIAEKLGNTLVAPIVKFVPEGDIEPATGHMLFPGTISLSEETYERLITDIVSSLKQHGFTDIILIGDSGGNQKCLDAVANALNTKWHDEKVRVHYIPEYYQSYPKALEVLTSRGYDMSLGDIHDDFLTSSSIALNDPKYMRMEERKQSGLTSINGNELLPLENSLRVANEMANFRADLTIDAIHKKLNK